MNKSTSGKEDFTQGKIYGEIPENWEIPPALQTEIVDAACDAWKSAAKLAEKTGYTETSISRFRNNICPLKGPGLRLMICNFPLFDYEPGDDLCFDCEGRLL